MPEAPKQLFKVSRTEACRKLWSETSIVSDKAILTGTKGRELRLLNDENDMITRTFPNFSIATGARENACPRDGLNKLGGDGKVCQCGKDQMKCFWGFLK